MRGNVEPTVFLFTTLLFHSVAYLQWAHIQRVQPVAMLSVGLLSNCYYTVHLVHSFRIFLLPA